MGKPTLANVREQKRSWFMFGYFIMFIIVHLFMFNFDNTASSCVTQLLHFSKCFRTEAKNLPIHFKVLKE